MAGIVNSSCYIFRLSDGTSHIQPQVIITGLKAHVIEDYINHCNAYNIKTFSFSTLFKILKTIKPSQRTNLAGLDDIIARGIESLDILETHINAYCPDGQEKMLYVRRLEKAKRFFKNTHLSHIKTSSNVAQHCTQYLLSDPKNKKFSIDCDHTHDITCEECLEPFMFFQKLQMSLEAWITDEHERIKTLYELEECVVSLKEWVYHNIRAHQQYLAKTDAIEHLSEETALLVRDYAMKFLPVRFREGQFEWFGKKGMSIHMTVVQFVVNGSICTKSYMVTLNNSDQGSGDTLCLSKLTLEELKNDAPQVKNLLCKQDNATSYAGKFTIVTIRCFSVFSTFFC